VEGIVWDWIKSLLSDPQALQDGLDARIAETEQQVNPFRERLAMIGNLMEQNKNELERALELYLSGKFPKEMLISRKNELETTLQSLEQERIRLSEVIEDQTLSPQQIQSIYEFASSIGETLDTADQDFHQRRSIIDALDVRVVLTVENDEKVIYAQCALDDGKFKIDHKKGPNGSGSTGKNFSNMSVENCVDFHRKNLHRVHQDSRGSARQHAHHR
jgi:hypothetical protein